MVIEVDQAEAGRAAASRAPSDGGRRAGSRDARGGGAARDAGGGRAIPRAARIAAGATAVLLAVHMLATAIFNAPAPEVRGSSAWQLANGYVQPYLVQDYKIFAPEPIDSDRQFWVRAWVETPGGERITSEWVNATEVELAADSRKLLRKQVSIVGAERLMAAYRGLTDAQRAAAVENHLEGSELYALRDAMIAADGSNPGAVDAFIRAGNFTTSYATQVSRALWGDQGEIIAVQTRAVYSPVIRWDDRRDPAAERPASSYTDLGWTPTLEWAGQDREAFARSFRAWAETAGVTTRLEPPGSANADSDANADSGTDGQEAAR
jgi:hypothetical protein